MNYASKVLAAKLGIYCIGNGLLVVLATANPLWLLPSLIWLIQKPRIIQRHLMPILFPYIQCTNPECRYFIPTDQRTKKGQQVHNCVESLWRMHMQGEEVGMLTCPRPNCGTTLRLQYWTGSKMCHVTIVGNAFCYAPYETRPNLLSRVLSIVQDRVQGDSTDFVMGTIRDSVFHRRSWLSRILQPQRKSQEIRVPLELRFRHSAIFGASGMGKSSLMLENIRSDMEAGHGVTVVEPNGKLIRDCLRYVPHNRIDDVILIRAGDIDCPFQMNPLVSGEGIERWNTNAELLRTIATISGSWGSEIEYNIDKALRTASAIGGSLRDAYDLLTVASGSEQLLIGLDDQRLTDFWQQWRSATRKSRTATIRKIEVLMEHPIIGRILGARRSNFDAASAIRDRKIVLVDLSTQSDTPEVIHSFGGVVIRTVKAKAFQQTEDEAIPHFLYIDEARNFMHKSMDFAAIFSEARKKKLGLTIATQHPHQLDNDVLEEVFTNVGTITSFAVDLKYAKTLADRMDDVQADEIMRQDVRECVTRIHRETYRVKAAKLPVVSDEDDPTDKIIARTQQLNADRIDDDPLRKPVAVVTEKQASYSLPPEYVY